MNEENAERPEEKQKTSLLDLNETIFHEIFQYLTFDEIDFAVRYTSKTLSEFVQYYFESHSPFILVSECNNSRYKYTKPALKEQLFFKTISILTRNKTIVGFESRRKNDLPSPKSMDPSSIFFEAIGGKLIYGYFDFEKVLSPRTLKKLGRKPGHRLFAHLFEYNSYTKAWLPITCSYSLQPKIFGRKNGAKILISNCCRVQDAVFLFLAVSTHSDSRLTMVDYRLAWILFEIPANKTEGKDISDLTYSVKLFDLSSHTDGSPASCHAANTWKVVGLSSNEIILLGVNYSGSINVWRVRISKLGSSISWKSIKFSPASDTSLMFRRNYDNDNLTSTSFVFKLRDNIYVFSNWGISRYPMHYPKVTSCRLNIKEEKYYDNDVSASPWNICRIISVRTDEEETYSLLLCLVDSGVQYEMRLIFFNEADGFRHKMNNSNFSNHFCKEVLAHSFDTLLRIK